MKMKTNEYNEMNKTKMSAEEKKERQKENAKRYAARKKQKKIDDAKEKESYEKALLNLRNWKR